jgi:hypothetical protein
MSPETCIHTVPLTLRAKLPFNGICPPCFVNAQVDEIKNIQAGLRNRGGIFTSKGTYGLDKKVDESQRPDDKVAVGQDPVRRPLSDIRESAERLSGAF